MFNIRLIPTLITIVLAACLLFGGWYLYQTFAIEKPFDKLVSQIEGVKSAKPVIERDRVYIDLQLEQGAMPEQVYREIKLHGQSFISKRELEVKFAEATNERLESLWNSVLFEIAEAMENRKYSAITDVMQRLEQEHAGVTIHTGIDDANIYITMTEGNAAKYIVLPRIPAAMGVWPNA